jgi:anti-sigma B factor antagonist
MSALDVERIDGVPVARCRQDIDAASAAAVSSELSACLGADNDSLVLDLSATRYVDSAGLDMLFRLGERLAQRRSTLLLVIPEGSQLKRLASLVALPEALPVHETVESALRAIAEAEKRSAGQAPVPDGDESTA